MDIDDRIDAAVLKWINDYMVPVSCDSMAYRELVLAIGTLIQYAVDGVADAERAKIEEMITYHGVTYGWKSVKWPEECPICGSDELEVLTTNDKPNIAEDGDLARCVKCHEGGTVMADGQASIYWDDEFICGEKEEDGHE